MKRNSSSTGAPPPLIPPDQSNSLGQPPVRVGSPAEILAAVPYLIGFHPTRSLVVIGARPPRDRVHVSFRYDLPDPPEAGYAREIAEHATAVLVNQHVTVAIVTGYGPGALVTPIAEEFRARLNAAGVEVREMLRVESSRYWSYMPGIASHLRRWLLATLTGNVWAIRGGQCRIDDAPRPVLTARHHV